MDPLSITLAVITLATALKDIIETAEIIQDSFSKLPQNYRDAKRLAEEVLETLRGMEEIYQEYEQTFNKNKSLKKAIKKLQVEMKSAHEKCILLIPPISESKRDRFRIAWYSFWRRSKVERLLSELKDHVDRCSQQFHLLSSFQADALIVEIHDTVVQSTTHRSAVINSHNSPSDIHMSNTGFGSRTNSQLYAFTQSTPMPMTWMTNTIPVHELSKAYLRREVRRVNISLHSIVAQWSQNPPADINIPCTSNILATSLQNQLPPSATVIHQDTLVSMFRLQSLLQSHKSALWIDDVNNMLSGITANLNDLQMYDDCIIIETSAVTFWRIFMKWHPSPASSRYLAEALTQLGRFFSNAGNNRQAYSAREEAIGVISSLAVYKPTMELDKQDVQLIAENRIRQARHVLSDGSLRLALDGHNMLEGIFKLRLTELRSGTICFVPDVPFPLSGQIVPSRSLEIELESQEISDDDCFTYASGLLHIAKTHRRLKLPESSRKLATLSLTILNHLFAKYPGSGLVHILLQSAFKLLLLDKTINATGSQSDAQNLEYIRQYVTVLRRLAPSNPQRHVRHLTRALWLQRKVLLALGKLAEAENAYESIIDLKDLAAAPAHSGLQVPSETEADYYSQLAEYHYEAERYSDAIYAGQNAISQYTALEFMNPGQSRENHLYALLVLFCSFSATFQYDKMLSEGYKALKMIENSHIYGPESYLVVAYGRASTRMMKALKESSHPEALAQAEDLSARIEKLARSRELKFREELAPALIDYAYLLQNKSGVEEAIAYLQKMLNDWGEMFGDLENTLATKLHCQCLQKLKYMTSTKKLNGQ